MKETDLSTHERLMISEIRRARQNRKRPSTYVIRVVDGIVQFMIASPIESQLERDICHLDKANGSG